MDIILNVNNSKNKVLRESNYKRRDQQDVVITYSGIKLSQIFFLKLFALKKGPLRRGGHIGRKWK